MQGARVVSLFFCMFILYGSVVYDRVQCVKVKLPQNKRNSSLGHSKKENKESFSEKHKKSINFLNVLNEEAKQSTERLSEALDKLSDKISTVLSDKIATFLQESDNLTNKEKQTKDTDIEDSGEFSDSDLLDDSNIIDSGIEDDEDIEIPEDLSDLSNKVTKDDLKELKKVIVDNTISEITEDLDKWDLENLESADLEEDVEKFSDKVVQGLVNNYDAKKLEKNIRKHDLLDFMNETATKE